MNTDSRPNNPSEPAKLRRDVGLFGAMMMGLGSIVGTGVFVSIGIAAGITGPSVVLAILVAGLVATFNGLSSAQLAAAHPVSGGTYEYGYRWLTPSMGFTAGWMFLCAKSASAATAALGFAGYALQLFQFDHDDWIVPLAIGAVVATTLLLLGGIRRSNWTNIAIVSMTLIALASFVIAGLPFAWREGSSNLTPFFASDSPAIATRQFLERIDVRRLHGLRPNRDTRRRSPQPTPNDSASHHCNTACIFAAVRNRWRHRGRRGGN